MLANIPARAGLLWADHRVLRNSWFSRIQYNEFACVNNIYKPFNVNLNPYYHASGLVISFLLFVIATELYYICCHCKLGMKIPLANLTNYCIDVAVCTDFPVQPKYVKMLYQFKFV